MFGTLKAKARPFSYDFVNKYNDFVKKVSKEYSEAEAMAIAVGGNYERVGAKELLLLEKYGLEKNSYVVDIGCGSGRLAKRLKDFPEVKYLGTDIVQDLLNYGDKMCARPDFKFELVRELKIPEKDGRADLACFFSVITHLLHEHSYIYLEEAARILKPGGRIICSFLEISTALGTDVFKSNIGIAKRNEEPPHLNILCSKGDMTAWGEMLGLKILDYHSGDEKFLKLESERFMPHLEAGEHSFGQSIIVFQKP